MEVFAAVIASLMVLYAGACCPPNWQSNGSSCYYVSLREKASWPDAETYCRVFGGYLVDINNAAEDQFVRGLAKLTGAGHVWIGATDIQQEDMWLSSHTQKKLEYGPIWGPAQPDHDGNCMCLYQGPGYLWGDTICKNEEIFICERPAM